MATTISTHHTRTPFVATLGIVGVIAALGVAGVAVENGNGSVSTDQAPAAQHNATVDEYLRARQNPPGSYAGPKTHFHRYSPTTSGGRVELGQ